MNIKGLIPLQECAPRRASREISPGHCIKSAKADNLPGSHPAERIPSLPHSYVSQNKSLKPVQDKTDSLHAEVSYRGPRLRCGSAGTILSAGVCMHVQQGPTTKQAELLKAFTVNQRTLQYDDILEDLCLS